MSAGRTLRLRNEPEMDVSTTPKQSSGFRTPLSTPKSGGGGSSKTVNLRRELFSGGGHQDMIASSSPLSSWKSAIGRPDWSPSPSKRQRPVPDHFKQQMPTSARKEDPEPGPPSHRFQSIRKTSFYGGGSAKLSPAAVRAQLNRSSSQSSDNSLDGFESAAAAASPAKKQLPQAKRQPLKPKNSKVGSKVDDSKSALRKRTNASVGKVTKVKAVSAAATTKVVSRRKVAGNFNKGVSHAIKKPSKKLVMKRKKQREERLKKEAKKAILAAAKENSNSASGKVIKAASAAFKKSFFEDLDDDDKSLNKKARRRKSLNVSSNFQRNNVSYEIKNGQPVFHLLRRSPRKCCLGDDKVEKVDRPSPKLFNPSGHADFLPGSSPLRRKRHVPSPIKFHDNSTEDEDNKSSSNHVQNIIENLEREEVEANEVTGNANDVTNANDVSQDECAVYVTDDELVKVARDAANEVAEIAAADAEAAEATASASDDQPMEAEDAAATIQNILMNMEPVTEEEVSERRNTRNRKNSGKSGAKDSSATATANYPIFENRRLTRSRSNTPQKMKKTVTSSAAAGPVTSTIEPDASGKKQMVIDAGQKKIGAQYCVPCDFVYTSGEADEERLHDEKHATSVAGVIKFSGWRNENAIETHDGKIVIVGPSDNKRHWEKVHAVLQVVDSLLGIAPADGTDNDVTKHIENGGASSDVITNRVRNQKQSKAFMFVAENRVVGMLFAEILNKTDKVEMSTLHSFEEENKAKQKCGKQQQQRVLKAISEASRVKVGVGVTRIWVTPQWQRRGVATRLVDAMRSNFLPAKVLEKHEFAFSHTTPAGSDFAASYVGSQDFLTYAPPLPGQQ